MEMEVEGLMLDHLRARADDPRALRWLVDRVFVIERHGCREQFEIVGEIMLFASDAEDKAE